MIKVWVRIGHGTCGQVNQVSYNNTYIDEMFSVKFLFWLEIILCKTYVTEQIFQIQVHIDRV